VEQKNTGGATESENEQIWKAITGVRAAQMASGANPALTFARQAGIESGGLAYPAEVVSGL
jgi:hypothetical protein